MVVNFTLKILYQAGCEDGCVRLFDTTSGDIEYARVFSKQEGKLPFILEKSTPPPTLKNHPISK